MAMSMPCSECCGGVGVDVDRLHQQSGPVISYCGGYFCDDCFVQHHCGRCDTIAGKEFNEAAFACEMIKHARS